MKKTNTYDFEFKVALFLRYGILCVALILFVSWIFSINFKENVFLDYQNYKEVSLISTLQDVWNNKQWSLLLSYFGLSVLILLPLFRVLMTCLLFAKQKEYIMTTLCFIVLLSLLFSFYLGAVH